MKIFVSGVAGFLGSHLADRFLAEGHEVVGIDNLSGGHVINVNPNVSWSHTDCNHFEEVKKMMQGVDVVYHCAALAHEGLSVFSPKLITDSIYGASVSMMSAAIASGVKRFVHMSSMARYGSIQNPPFTEDGPVKPQDPYGIAKYAAEQTLKLLSHVHGIELVIAIPHNIIGPRQKYDDPFRNVASIMLNRMLSGKQPIIYGNGMQKRCFSYVEDDLPILMKFSDLKNKAIVGETFNVGPDEEFVTIYDLANICAEITGTKLNPIFMPDRPQEVKEANCSADKIRKWFGYNTQWKLKDGLIKMAEYIQIHGVKEFNYHINLEIVNEKTPKTWLNKLI